MANVNVVILAGNLTADPELKFTPSGTAVAQLRMAINRRFKDSRSNEMREETTFVDVELWGRSAETAKEYLHKGRPVMIEGRLKLDQWEDRGTGQKRSKLKVVADRFHFLGSSGGGQGGGGGGGGGGGQRQHAQRGGGREASQARDEYNQDYGGNYDDLSPPVDEDMPNDGVPF
jgi:single-strand DNA-binding protein